MTSKHLGIWLAFVAAITTASQTVPDVAPAWIGVWLGWAAGILSALTAAYVAWSPNVTLPAERTG